MTLCPIAIAVGCKKCPAFKFCPLTTVLGDQQEEDEIDWSEAISQKEIPYTSDDPDFLSTNRSTVPKKSKPKSAGSTNTPVDKIEDEYQRYAEEELEKNTKQMESFKGEDAEVIPKNKKLTKNKRHLRNLGKHAKYK